MLQAVRVGDATTPDHEVEVDLGSQLRTLYDQHYRSLVKMAAFYLDDVWTALLAPSLPSRPTWLWK